MSLLTLHLCGCSSTQCHLWHCEEFYPAHPPDVCEAGTAVEFFIRLITLPQELGHQQWSLMVSVIPCYFSLIKTCRNDNSLGISLCFSIVFNHSNNWLEIRNGKHSYSVIRYEWDVFMGKRYSQTCWKVPCYILYHVISIRIFYYYYLGWVIYQ